MKFHIYSLNKNISFRIKSNTAISKRGTQDPIDENDGKKLKIDTIDEGPDNSSDIVELTPVCELVVMADQAIALPLYPQFITMREYLICI